MLNMFEAYEHVQENMFDFNTELWKETAFLQRLYQYN